MDKWGFISGCRSGIQKAVRRGDLDLAKTCFDVLWNSREERSWFKWRLPVIVAEEAVYMVGELAEFVEKESMEEKDWRRFYYRLVLAPKARDAHGLLVAAGVKALDSEDHLELSSIRTQLVRDDFLTANLVFDLMTMLRTRSNYSDKACDFLSKRIAMGGKVSDRKMMATAVVLFVHRGLGKREVTELIDDRLSDYLNEKEERKPRTITLPWYVFDYHTTLGASVLRKFVKENPTINAELVRRLWFCVESAYTPPELSEHYLLSMKTRPEIWETMWWPRVLVSLLSKKDAKLRSVVVQWNEEMKPRIQELVEWEMDRRKE